MKLHHTPDVFFTIGADPEVFACDKDGNPASCMDLLGGSKEAPRRVEHSWIQEDNVMAEFNIEPCFTRDQFIESIGLALYDVQEALTPHGLTIAHGLTTAKFTRKQLFDPRAFRFGCDADYGINGMLPVPNIPRYTRYAGGHIHIGLDDATLNMMSPAYLSMYMDLYVGLYGVYADPDTQRKKKYGTPTRHRPKYYGVEYRSASNFWIFKPETVGLVYDLTSCAIDAARQNRFGYGNGSDVINAAWRAMEKNDRKQAQSIMLDHLGIDIERLVANLEV